MSLLQQILGNSDAGREKICAIDTCDDTEVEVVQLRALDPVDHDDTFVHLCEDHQEWAAARNKFAFEIAEELRSKRVEIGLRESERVKELRFPDDGKIEAGASLSMVKQAEEIVADTLGVTSDG